MQRAGNPLMAPRVLHSKCPDSKLLLLPDPPPARAFSLPKSVWILSKVLAKSTESKDPEFHQNYAGMLVATQNSSSPHF